MVVCAVETTNGGCGVRAHKSASGVRCAVVLLAWQTWEKFDNILLASTSGTAWNDDRSGVGLQEKLESANEPEDSGLHVQQTLTRRKGGLLLCTRQS